MKIDWVAKLRYYLQTLAFCLAVSAIQYSFQPDRPYEHPLIYSLSIGSSTWALIDFGRHLFASSAVTGWPQGWSGLGLALAGIVGGYLLGTLAGDAWFGCSSWQPGPARDQMRVSIIVTALAGIVGSYFFYSVNHSGYLVRQVTEASQHANEARLKLLETQLEPHMLFNTLANLRALIGADPASATVMLDRMIAYLRATLTASRATTHPLSDEFSRLRDYLELMAVRMGPRLRYTLELPEELSKQPVPTLLLQPLVENSIQHGLEPRVDGGSITVRARRHGAVLTLEVIDTGVGVRAAAPGAAGFGLAQVRERLTTAYGSQVAIDLIAEPGGGTRVTLSIPCAP